MKKIIWFLVILLIILFVFLVGTGKLSNVLNKKSNEIEPVSQETISYDEYSRGNLIINGLTIPVIIANDTEKHIKGLSNRLLLPEDEGMFFVFEEPAEYMFWMKDMQFPLDIIWFSKDLEIIHLESNLPPETYPDYFGPKKDSMYVLEVKAGFGTKNNLKIGDKAEFLP
ncbi:hypothetical protein A2995_00490 [Candidatus Nomurabacteria bacterium RIFCSPLOWO2_01_FULL_33_24]|uniref:DUF192 domain-containing protein n=1 Tax=Candidatus Nomurabacteria bacterium RIFCSPLOWO2_01_FULL_33_24 TaxID=1801765 RepID=A0A1F6WYS8_9BACT|nr:MAG: hypothetical protein A2995_00490 [Candidatus Nomurabacteria bacterium RIFCSPLOWO2_01_FULL_33_24]